MTGSFLNAARREADLDTLTSDDKPVDVVVIGGGVTGTGAALDAAARGLSVVLLERRDLANGTSRWSSKLAHGGLRYLASMQFGIAWESARERHRLSTSIAPHLIRALPQVTPSFGRVPQPESGLLEVGVRIGDAMRALAGTSHRRLPAMRRIGAEEARQWVPALTSDGLRGGILHWDGQLEDDARLVVGLARTAAALGARVITYAEVEAITGNGVHVHDAATGDQFDVKARHVINATGVWAGSLAPGLRLRPSKGSHLLVRAERLDNPRAALLVPIPGHFGRFVFAVPRPDDLVLIGLTDDPYDGPIPDVPEVKPEEEAFLLETASTALDRTLSRADVVGRYAGLRPLLDAGEGATADVSRQHAVIEDPSSGAVTVVGGKLTTYRQMAQDAVDFICRRGDLAAGPCLTDTLPIVGAQPHGTRTPPGVPQRLVRRYGAEASAVAALAQERPELLDPIAPGVPILGVELLVAREWEGALTAADVLDIRTRASLVPEWREAAGEALERLAPDLDAVMV
ncbi:MAG: glycerol-3-phosphate dehydrogenase/oxidase [Solirubrobacteraceae bacterium]